MAIGKHADGLKGFPTPNTAAGIAGYLLFLFEDRELAQWLLGALEPMQYEFNWYKAGDLSTDEAAALFEAIVQQAPYNLKTCANPAGGRIIRIGATGHVEELSDANTWEEPTGDYAIPAVPERTGGTPDEQLCLAAMNAANVLQLLYENITDSFNDDLDEAEAATALTLSIIALIGVEFAPITFALVTFFGIIFSVLYGLLEFIGADLWDADFTAALVCILKGCASNDAGVITFDYTCFNEALAAQVTVIDLTFEQLRLFGQIQYLLLVIGALDALNAAGATTEITVPDCGCAWHYRWLGGDGIGDWVTPTTLLGKNAGVYNSGDDQIDGTIINGFNNVWANALLTETLQMTRIAVTYNTVNTGGAGSEDSSVNFIKDGMLVSSADYHGGVLSGVVYDWINTNTFSSMGFVFTAQVSMEIIQIDLFGIGTTPNSGVEIFD